jgi:hypothetical protein
MDERQISLVGSNYRSHERTARGELERANEDGQSCFDPNGKG